MTRRSAAALPSDAVAAHDEHAASTGDRMTQLEAVMWILDGDPRLASGFANLTILDRPPDRDVLRSRMVDASIAVPRLRQRVVSTAGLGTPRWETDPDFDIEHHLRWVDLDDRDVDQLGADLSGRPFDRDRPLWEFVVIEGLPDGQAAMVQRFDHTLTDGEGGIRLSVQFLDLERHPDRPAPDPADDVAATPSGPADGPDGDGDEPGGLGRAVNGIRDALLAAPGAALRGAASVPAGAGAAIANAGGAIGMAKGSVQQLAVDRRRSPLWTQRSTDRWFGRSALHLDDAKAAAHRLGGSVNDLFVTGALAAAAQVHAAADAPVDELRVAIPISNRNGSSGGGNAFTPVHALLPSGPMDPTERFAAVHGRLDQLKRGTGSMNLDAPAAAARLLPPSALIGLVGRTAGAIDFVCSNVRAAPFDLFIAGSHLDANYPLGPLLNTSFNLTTMSYRGWLFLGLLVDRAAVHEPEQLLAALDDGYREVLAAGGVSEHRKPDLAM